MAIRQIELKEILLPYFAATMGARHHGEMRGAIQPYGDVAEFGKYLEVAAGSGLRESPRVADQTSQLAKTRTINAT